MGKLENEILAVCVGVPKKDCWDKIKKLDSSQYVYKRFQRMPENLFTPERIAETQQVDEEQKARNEAEEAAEIAKLKVEADKAAYKFKQEEEDRLAREREEKARIEQERLAKEAADDAKAKQEEAAERVRLAEVQKEKDRLAKEAAEVQEAEEAEKKRQAEAQEAKEELEKASQELAALQTAQNTSVNLTDSAQQSLHKEPKEYVLDCCTGQSISVEQCNGVGGALSNHTDYPKLGKFCFHELSSVKWELSEVGNIFEKSNCAAHCSEFKMQSKVKYVKDCCTGREITTQDCHNVEGKIANHTTVSGEFCFHKKESVKWRVNGEVFEARNCEFECSSSEISKPMQKDDMLFCCCTMHKITQEQCSSLKSHQIKSAEGEFYCVHQEKDLSWDSNGECTGALHPECDPTNSMYS